jgi:valyl-tRNA synthetase
MSKSLGNGIDPLDVVRLYGADALRYTVISGMGMGADLILDPNDLEKSFAPGRNFATKLWNIGRFLLTNVGEDTVEPVSAIDPATLTRADRWILARLDAAITECNAALGPVRPAETNWPAHELRSGLRLNEYTETARRFVWNELADWYLESTKARLATVGSDRDVARAVLVHVFDAALRLLHPVVPFITEALWQRLPRNVSRASEFLAVASWPIAGTTFDNAGEFEAVRDAVNALRTVRSDYTVPPSTIVDAAILPKNGTRIYQEEASLIGKLARANVTVGTVTNDTAAAHALLGDGAELIVPLGGIVDTEKEYAKLQKEIEQLDKQLTALNQRLANPGFLSRAPANVVEGERVKADEWTKRRDQMRTKLASFRGA